MKLGIGAEAKAALAVAAKDAEAAAAVVRAAGGEPDAPAATAPVKKIATRKVAS
jgi:hypothetical protein